MTIAIGRIQQDIATRRGWAPTNAGEARVANILHSFGVRPLHGPAGPETDHGRRRRLRDQREAVAEQYRVGRYRLDFAWPAVSMAIEADGWAHRNVAGALRDLERDGWLASRGWLVFRVDVDQDEDLIAKRLVRVVRLVRSELATGSDGFADAGWLPDGRRRRA